MTRTARTSGSAAPAATPSSLHSQRARPRLLAECNFDMQLLTGRKQAGKGGRQRGGGRRIGSNARRASDKAARPPSPVNRPSIPVQAKSRPANPRSKDTAAATNLLSTTHRHWLGDRDSRTQTERRLEEERPRDTMQTSRGGVRKLHSYCKQAKS